MVTGKVERKGVVGGGCGNKVFVFPGQEFIQDFSTAEKARRIFNIFFF